MYGFAGVPGESVIEYEDFEADLANFLLVRGPHAWLGHGWHGCSLDYGAISESSCIIFPPPCTAALFSTVQY